MKNVALMLKPTSLSMFSRIRAAVSPLVIGALVVSSSAFAENGPDLSARDARAQLGMSCVLVAKDGVPDDLMKAFWGDIHGPLGSKNLGVDGYWEHWLGKGRTNFFPTIAGVDQELPTGAPISGLAEITFRTTDDVAKLAISPSVGQIMQDEQNIFSKTYMYATAPGGAVTVLDRTTTNATEGKPEGYNVIVFVRQSHAVSTDQFRSFLKGDFAETLAKSSDVLKVRYHLYEKYNAKAWATPNVDHDRSIDEEYSAYMELSFISAQAAEHFMHSAGFKALTPAISTFILALNTYPDEETYTMVYEGVPTTAGLRGVSAAKTMARLGQPKNERSYPVLKILYGDAVKEPTQ